jgi:hypothetical protein
MPEPVDVTHIRHTISLYNSKFGTLLLYISASIALLYIYSTMYIALSAETKLHIQKCDGFVNIEKSHNEGNSGFSQKTALERWRPVLQTPGRFAMLLWVSAELAARRARTKFSMCTHACSRQSPAAKVAHSNMRRPGRPIGGYCILGKLFQTIFIFYCALELRSLIESRVSISGTPNLLTVSVLNNIRRIQIEFRTKFLTTLWTFEIYKKYFANSSPSLLKIEHCRPVLKFWKRIHNT